MCLGLASIQAGLFCAQDAAWISATGVQDMKGRSGAPRVMPSWVAQQQGRQALTGELLNSSYLAKFFRKTNLLSPPMGQVAWTSTTDSWSSRHRSVEEKATGSRKSPANHHAPQHTGLA